MNNFEQGPIRPPAEADSLLIRTTRGCPWNRCHFCTLFKGMRFSIRPVDEIRKDISAARLYYHGANFETCFLQDGDSFAMRTKCRGAYYGGLAGFQKSSVFISVQQQVDKILRKNPESIEVIFHDLRNRII